MRRTRVLVTLTLGAALTASAAVPAANAAGQTMQYDGKRFTKQIVTFTKADALTVENKAEHTIKVTIRRGQTVFAEADIPKDGSQQFSGFDATQYVVSTFGNLQFAETPAATGLNVSDS